MVALRAPGFRSITSMGVVSYPTGLFQRSQGTSCNSSALQIGMSHQWYLCREKVVWLVFPLKLWDGHPLIWVKTCISSGIPNDVLALAHVDRGFSPMERGTWSTFPMRIQPISRNQRDHGDSRSNLGITTAGAGRKKLVSTRISLSYSKIYLQDLYNPQQK